jgi:hypothetical protein
MNVMKRIVCLVSVPPSLVLCAIGFVIGFIMQGIDDGMKFYNGFYDWSIDLEEKPIRANGPGDVYR